jgi:Flp pilus assembly protein TadG
VVRGAAGVDEASVSAFVALMLVALFVVLGMVVDGGTALADHQSAVDEAEQAARAGAGALSVDALRSGSLQLDPQAAIAAAEAFTVAAGHPGSATVSSGVVTVSIRYRMPTSVLGIVGIDSLSVSATASAVDLGGVVRGTP